MLNHTILARPAVYARNQVKCEANDKKPDDLVQKGPICHNHRAIIQRLADGVIALCAVATVILPTPQDCKLFVEITVQKGEERDNGQDDIASKRLYDCCKGRRNAVNNLVKIQYK